MLVTDVCVTFNMSPSSLHESDIITFSVKAFCLRFRFRRHSFKICSQFVVPFLTFALISSTLHNLNGKINWKIIIPADQYI